jgi:hypothetical protein
VPTATFTADFTKWNQALRDASTSLKPLEVSAKGVQQQLQRMATSLSGATIIKQANIATEAVKSIGGATKLTEAEQRKLNATVTEAIAKYASLGQKAPADMIALAKATKQSESAFSGISTALGPIKGLLAGAFAVTSITRAAGEALKFASDLNDLSAKTGISTKALQEFKFAGDQVGVTLDDVSGAILQMQKHLVGGDKSVLGALKTIGVSFKDLQGLAPEEQFKRIAEGLSKIEDPALRNKTAFDIMGKAAANVLPLIATDLKKTADEAERLGIVLDQETINQLDNLGDTWAKVKLAGEALVAKALVPMAPALIKVLEAIIPLAASIGKLPTDFKKLEIELLQMGVITRQAALSFIELTKWTQPLNVATGQYEKQVKSIQGEMLGLIDKVGKAQQELKDMQAPQKAVTDGAKKAATAFGEWGDKAKESQEKIHAGADVIRESLGTISDALEKVQERSDAAFEALNQAEELTSLKQQLDQVANRIEKVDEVETEWIEGTQHLLVNKSTVVKDYFNAIVKNQKEANKGSIEWEQSLNELSQAFAQLAQVSDGAFGGVLKDIAQLISLMNVAAKASQQVAAGIAAWKSATTASGKAAAGIQIGAGVASGVGAVISATSVPGKGNRVLGGAAAGAQAGAAFGPYGVVIGAAIGALVGALRKDPRWAQEMQSIAKDFGENISKEVGQAIEQLAKAKFGGNRQAAQIASLDQIISSGGGITAKNLDQLEARLHDVFSLIQTGAFSASDAQDVLNKNFQTFVDFLGGRVNPALKEIIKLNNQFGTQSKAIADYVDAQANKALSSLTKVISARGDLVSQLEAAQKKGDKGAIAKLQAQLAALPLTAGGGQALGASLFGIFERLTKDGASALDVLSQLDPVIESLDKQLSKAGLSGGAAFDQIKSLAGIATDEIAGPAFQAIQAYGQALEGLNNSAVLTQEEFSGLTEQITATYTAAVDALVKQGKDGSKALHLIAPQLQEIWELQQDFGYAVDDSTQKLLDQAVAAGDVGEKHRSIQEQTLDVLQHVSDVLDLIGEKFGVDIPRDVDKTVKAFDKVGTKIDDAIAKIPDNVHIGVKFDIPELPDNYTPLSHGGAVPFSKGGPVYAAGGYFASKGTDTIPAMLSPGEFVISRRGVQAAGMPALRSINQGVPPMGGGIVTTINVYVNNKLDHAESQKIAAAIAPHLPGVVANGGATHGKWQRMTKVLAK